MTRLGVPAPAALLKVQHGVDVIALKRLKLSAK